MEHLPILYNNYILTKKAEQKQHEKIFKEKKVTICNHNQKEVEIFIMILDIKTYVHKNSKCKKVMIE